MSTSFGTLLRDKRVAARKSLREFARAMDLPATHVASVERGEAPPFEAHHVRAAAAFLGCDADELLRAAVRIDDAYLAVMTKIAEDWDDPTPNLRARIKAEIARGRR